MPPVADVTGVILAGGRSSRFGENKAFAAFKGGPVIQRVIEVMKKSFSDLVLVTNTPETYSHLGIRVLKDIIANQGPLGGIVTAFQNTESERIFVVGCDMPILNARTIESIVSAGPRADAVLPVHGEICEYLMALYARSLAPAMKRHLLEGRLSLHEFCDTLSNVCRVPVEDDSWFNVNTKKDLDLLESTYAD